MYRDQARYAEAEPLHKRALAIREKALGAEHPDVATNLNNLAELYRDQARYAEADSLLQFIVDHYGSDILADDALFMLAELNEQQLNNHEKARQCYEKLILDYPSSLYVDRARKRYRK